MDYQNGGYQPNNAQALDWDADFTAQDTDRSPLLPEGDYRFEIVKVERAHHGGSAKIPACNKAIVTFRILSTQGEAIIKENYYLLNEGWRKQMMTAFFASIGLADRETVENHGSIKPHWSNEIAGRRGVCHIAPRTYQRDGQTYQTNDLKELYPHWNQPNVEPIAPPQNAGYTPQNQGYNPQQNTPYQPGAWNGGGMY